MPRLALRQPRRVRNSPLQHPHSLETPLLAGSPELVRAPVALGPSTLPESEPARVGRRTVHALLNVS